MTPSDDKINKRFLSKVSVADGGCHLWTAAKNREGYGHFNIGGACQLAHRVAWQLVNGPIPEGMHVCHHCDTPACVNPEHLFLGTDADNVADRDRKRRTWSKLSDADRLSIKTSGNLTQRDLAELYGVAQATISRAKNWEGRT